MHNVVRLMQNMGLLLVSCKLFYSVCILQANQMCIAFMLVVEQRNLRKITSVPVYDDWIRGRFIAVTTTLLLTASTDMQ